MTMLEISRSDHLENTGAGVDAASRPGLYFALKIFLCAVHNIWRLFRIARYWESGYLASSHLGLTVYSKKERSRLLNYQARQLALKCTITKTHHYRYRCSVYFAPHRLLPTYLPRCGL